MKFELVRNDITNMTVDAIVLPANPRLKEGPGASNAIFEKAGRRELKRELKSFDVVETGATVPTLGYNLNSTFVLHSVIPKWVDGNHSEYELLSSAYLSALTLADKMSCSTLAFPLLAAGNNGFDIDLAFEVAKESIESYEPENKLEHVILVIYDRDVMAMLRKVGIEVPEEITEEYIMEQGIECKMPGQRAINEVQDRALQFLDDGVRMVREYLDDPANRRMLIEAGTKIAANAIKNVAMKKL